MTDTELDGEDQGSVDDFDTPEDLGKPSPEYGPQEERGKPLVMVADDDAELRKLLRTHFDSIECHLIEASDGAETLEKVIVHKPDLLILDVMMPELNGWEVCKYIREHDEFDNVGVVMLTGIGPTNNELTSPLFGADDYIDKPFDFDELEFKMKKVLSERRVEGAG